MKIHQTPSPNFGDRKSNIDVNHLIIHYTGMKTGETALAHLCNEAAEVSAHYLIFENGKCHQLVNEDKRAWHAGIGSWDDVDDINSCSIGIELVNKGHEWGYTEFPASQINSLITLCHDILERHNIPPHNILGHSDIAPLRKQDPGEKFPWGLLYKHRIGLWVPAAPIKDREKKLEFDENSEVIKNTQRMLASYGYACPVTGKHCDATSIVLKAFQRHFRPQLVDGSLDLSTLKTLENLMDLFQKQ